jgi:hypothetical protein
LGTQIEKVTTRKDSAKKKKKLIFFFYRPVSTQIVRQCIYLIRSYRLYELCNKQLYAQSHTKEFGPERDLKEDTMDALHYLRKFIVPLVDYENKEEVTRLEQLCTHLCLPMQVETNENGLQTITEDFLFTMRTQLFQRLLGYFPSKMKEPSGSLIDAVKIM